MYCLWCVGNVLSLRIYDPAIQTGNNSCSVNKGGCQHLCLPLSDVHHKCQCATGYTTDPNDVTRCIGIEEFLFYSINWEIRGLALDGNNATQVLGPISRVSMASSVDFHACKYLLKRVQLNGNSTYLYVVLIHEAKWDFDLFICTYVMCIVVYS